MSVCEGCSAGCCRAFAVPITGADILRIMSVQALSFWDFVCRWADPKGIIARNHAPQFRFSDEPDMPYVICLSHSESELFPHATKCQFLEECPPSREAPRGEGRCGIYDTRPGACRAFPVRLAPQQGLAILYEVPANGRAGNDPAYQLCPRPWSTSDVDPITHLQDLVVARYEMEVFHLLAQAWNRTPGAWKDFPAFLEQVYSRRVQGPSLAEVTRGFETVRRAA